MAPARKFQMNRYTHITSQSFHFQTEVQYICFIKNTYSPYVKGSTSERVAKYRLLSENRGKSKRKQNRTLLLQKTTTTISAISNQEHRRKYFRRLSNCWSESLCACYIAALDGSDYTIQMKQFIIRHF